MKLKKRTLICGGIVFGVSLCTATFCSEDDIGMPNEEYCKILQKHVNLLGKFNELNKRNNIVDLSKPGVLSFLSRGIEFNHEIIKVCIEKIVESANLDPLLKTWDFAYDMCLSQKDVSFVKEFSILIFTIYESVLNAMPLEKIINHLKVSLEDILQVYNSVSDLPIKEIIVILEKCYVLFSKILVDYDAYSNMGWKEWVVRYWWIPPTIMLAVLGVLLRKKLSPGGWSRPKAKDDKKESKI